MLSILEILGIDEEELEWQDLAICSNMDTNLFYDSYEASDSIAKMVDDICLSCPVFQQCLQAGIENNEYGVWGGTYLSSGKMDKSRNSHKTPEVLEKMRELIE